MPVNLINEKAVDLFLADSIYGYKVVEGLSPEILKSQTLVRENREKIVQAITYQWMKAKFRNYLTQNEKSDYLEKVRTFDRYTPYWAKMAITKGENVYRFERDKVPFEKLQQLGRARNYLSRMAEKYVDEQLQLEKPRIRLDYLKTDHKINSMEKVLILYNKMMSRVDFSIGTKDVLCFRDGFKIVQLIGKDAFVAEGRGMDHCLGRDNYYGAYGKSHEFYSLRDTKNEPHVTIQVKNREIIQINGKGATAVNGKYHKYIFEFMRGRNLKVGGFAHADMGMIKVGEESFSIYNLPKDRCFTLESLDVSDYHLTKLPDLTNIKVAENFDISNSRFKNLQGCPSCRSLSIYDSTDFEENFLKDLPHNVESIEGFGMPVRCLKYLPRNSKLKEVCLDGGQLDPQQLYEIPYYTLKKIKFEGGSAEFNKTYEEAIHNGEEFLCFYNKMQIFGLLQPIRA